MPHFGDEAAFGDTSKKQVLEDLLFGGVPESSRKGGKK